VKLQANVYPGVHFAIKLVPPHLVTGHNFGATCMLLGICNMINLRKVTADTRTYVHATDGGSENRCKDHHALNWVLVKFGVFDKIIWCRLPPSHSHNFVDRIFSAIEAWLEDNTYDGCFHLFALREFLLKKFASSDSEYKNLDVVIDILLANFDFKGGSHWVDHLPFLLMAMRATGGRVTKQSPAPLLYGRELRLPSQLIDPRVPASVEFTESMSDVPKAYRQYVEQLNAHLRLAWLTALEATQDAQEESALGTARKTNTDVTFKVGDRVCRRIPGHSNKLQFLYSGPYRVLEVLSNSRYKLRDLENRLVHDEVHAIIAKRRINLR
jgi:hypothetical protein